MKRQLLPAVRMLIVMTIALGLVYPLAMTGVAQALFNGKADGSIVKDAARRGTSTPDRPPPATATTEPPPRRATSVRRTRCCSLP